MARLFGGIGTSHVPGIGAAVDNKKEKIRDFHNNVEEGAEQSPHARSVSATSRNLQESASPSQ